MSTVARFLRALWPELPAGAWLLIYTLPDKTSHWCQNVDEAVLVASEHAAIADVYLGMGLAEQNNGPFARATRNEITAIAGLWADLDCRADTRKKSALPATLDELLTVIPEDVPPTMLVATGGGYHAYWLFHEPLLLSSPADRAAAEKLLKDWQTLLRRRAQVHGWTLDYTHDLPRVLRVAGTANHKDPVAGPRAVTITKEGGPRYDPDELREILDDSDFADRETGVHHADAIGDGWKAIGIRVTANAAVDADLVEQLCQIDPRFRATWNHDRPDIVGPDGAFSEYDLAIANFGVAAGLDHQTIVDMMVEHRRRHGGKPKLRPDYYQRTLGRAMQQIGHAGITEGVRHGEVMSPGKFNSSTPPSTSTAAPASDDPEIEDAANNHGQDDATEPPPAADNTGSAPPPPPPPRNPDATRVAAMEMLSQWMGIRILRIVKITGSEPSYSIETEIGVVDVETTHKLLDASFMRARFAAVTRHLLRRFKGAEWDNICSAILANLVEKDGGDELELEGEIRSYLQHYLASRSFLTSLRGVPPAQTRLPIVVEGLITVSAVDIQQWIFREFSYRITLRDLAHRLTLVGGHTMRFRAAGIDQTRWCLPAHDWPANRYTEEEPAA